MRTSLQEPKGEFSFDPYLKSLSKNVRRETVNAIYNPFSSSAEQLVALVQHPWKLIPIYNAQNGLSDFYYDNLYFPNNRVYTGRNIDTKNGFFITTNNCGNLSEGEYPGFAQTSHERYKLQESTRENIPHFMNWIEEKANEGVGIFTTQDLPKGYYLNQLAADHFLVINQTTMTHNKDIVDQPDQISSILINLDLINVDLDTLQVYTMPHRQTNPKLGNTNGFADWTKANTENNPAHWPSNTFFLGNALITVFKVHGDSIPKIIASNYQCAASSSIERRNNLLALTQNLDKLRLAVYQQYKEMPQCVFAGDFNFHGLTVSQDDKYFGFLPSFPYALMGQVLPSSIYWGHTPSGKRELIHNTLMLALRENPYNIFNYEYINEISGTFIADLPIPSVFVKMLNGIGKKRKDGKSGRGEIEFPTDIIGTPVDLYAKVTSREKLPWSDHQAITAAIIRSNFIFTPAMIKRLKKQEQRLFFEERAPHITAASLGILADLLIAKGHGYF